MDGWISIHRKISDNPLWTCEPFTRGQAWVDLILLANFKYSFFYIRGIKIDVNIGQLAWSEEKLSERWMWSRSKLRKFLNDLKKERQIEQYKGGVIQIITILNYEYYQNNERQIEQQKDDRKTTERRQKDASNKDNKDNNVNNKDIPTFDEFKNYALEKEPRLDESSIKLKYESWIENGWKDGYNKKIVKWKSKLLNTIPHLKLKESGRSSVYKPFTDD